MLRRLVFACVLATALVGGSGCARYVAVPRSPDAVRAACGSGSALPEADEPEPVADGAVRVIRESAIPDMFGGVGTAVAEPGLAAQLPLVLLVLPALLVVLCADLPDGPLAVHLARLRGAGSRSGVPG